MSVLTTSSSKSPRRRQATVTRQAGGADPRWTMARFLAAGPEGLHTLYEARPRRQDQCEWSPDWAVVDSLVRVLERQGLRNVAQLGDDAAAAWAERVGGIR
jgi:hypothetical protein